MPTIAFPRQLVQLVSGASCTVHNAVHSVIDTAARDAAVWHVGAGGGCKLPDKQHVNTHTSTRVFK